MKRWVWIAVLGSAACGGPVADPLIEAHGGARGYWPPNSGAAVQGTVAADFDGLEVDLVLTRDGEALLSDDPWLDPDHCTDAAGEPLPKRVRIDGLDLWEIQRDFLCGGLRDPDFPNAEVVAAPPLSFEELLGLLQDANAGLRVHLDLKVERGWTPPAEDYLEPVLDRFWAADLPQSLVVSANTANTLRRFEEHARAADRDLHTLLIYPFAASDASDVSVGLGAEGRSLVGGVDYIREIEEAGADGIAVHFEVAERGKLLAALDAGYETALWTVNGADALETYSRWPVDVLISDYPGARP